MKASNASHSRNTFGITDVTTAKAHVEIKHWRNFKNALGQLLFYHTADQKKNLFVCFFGNLPTEERRLEINNVFAKHDITLIFFAERDDVTLHMCNGITVSLTQFCNNNL